ncbi:WecB/TagA/CpsF family glycosyltransferase [Symbiobacterium terraclitae]|uniref:WecB/TagA/CpsF family glycosyltransferase n=1 Tax=Symbiobacterium terraclitae TaxID=557451 RepID=UPI0035B50BE2
MAGKVNRVRILAIEVDRVTMAEAVERCLGFIDAGGAHMVVTPNAEIADAARRDPELAAIINGADLVVPDGIGVVMAARLLGDPLPERVGGADLAASLLAALDRRGGGRVFLLGTRPEVVAEAARRVQERYPRIRVVGWRDGFFGPEEEPAVLAQVREARPDVLFVALGSPKQERWLHRHLRDLGVPLGMGVGGTIDVWAGAVPRAPQWMQKLNLEWLFRIVRLRRASRSLPPLARFVLAVLRQRTGGAGKKR